MDTEVAYMNVSLAQQNIGRTLMQLYKWQRHITLTMATGCGGGGGGGGGRKT
jgi:hypothetical protein